MELELRKRQIHMDHIKCKAGTQITIEDDRNVPDNKPDMKRIICENGEVKTEEIKISDDKVTVKGKLAFRILYLTEETREKICCMEGDIPFEEQIYMDGVRGGDNICVKENLEDFKAGMINSRKLELKALVQLSLWVSQMHEEEAAEEVLGGQSAEMKKNMLTVAETAIQKKDILRFKEEIEIPASFPNVFEVVWDEVQPAGMVFTAVDEKLQVQGEFHIFLMYEGEGEEHSVKWFVKTIPFKETIECQGSAEGMIPDIRYKIGHREVEVRTDMDGEERIICLEFVLDMDMKLYREETMEILSDVYGVAEEIEAVKKKGIVNRLAMQDEGRVKLSENYKLSSRKEEIGEICGSFGHIQEEEAEVGEGWAEVNALLTVRTLYRTDSESGFDSTIKEFPVQYRLEDERIGENCNCFATVSLEQLSVAEGEGNTLEVKAEVDFRLLVMCSMEREMITDIAVREPDMEVIKELPGIVAYIAKEGDDIWLLGKKYRVPVSRIRETNELETDVLKEGDKILIVR